MQRFVYVPTLGSPLCPQLITTATNFSKLTSLHEKTWMSMKNGTRLFFSGSPILKLIPHHLDSFSPLLIIRWSLLFIYRISVYPIHIPFAFISIIISGSSFFFLGSFDYIFIETILTVTELSSFDSSFVSQLITKT